MSAFLIFAAGLLGIVLGFRLGRHHERRVERDRRSAAGFKGGETRRRRRAGATPELPLGGEP